jgi:hypothetical protein
VAGDAARSAALDQGKEGLNTPDAGGRSYTRAYAPTPLVAMRISWLVTPWPAGTAHAR